METSDLCVLEWGQQLFYRKKIGFSGPKCIQGPGQIMPDPDLDLCNADPGSSIGGSGYIE